MAFDFAVFLLKTAPAPAKRSVWINISIMPFALDIYFRGLAPEISASQGSISLCLSPVVHETRSRQIAKIKPG